jgi:hypothetical protein
VPQGLGMTVNYVENPTIENNLFIDKDYGTQTTRHAIDLTTGVTGTKVVRNNIIHKWVTDGEEIKPSSLESGNVCEPGSTKFVDPTRTLNTYFGVTNGEDALAQGMIKMRKGAWDQKFTADSILRYFREGYRLK